MKITATMVSHCENAGSVKCETMQTYIYVHMHKCQKKTLHVQVFIKMFLLQQEVLLYPIFHDTVLYHV